MQTCLIVEMGQWVSLEVTLSHKIYQCQRLRQAYATRDTFYQVLCGGYSGSSYCYITLTERFVSPGLMLHSVLSPEKDRPCKLYDLPLSTSTMLTGGSTPITFLLTDLLSYY